MEWIKINPDNLPKGKVLAASFDEGFTNGDFLLGLLARITWPNGKTEVECSSGDWADLFSLGGCTHYIDIHNCEHKESTR